VTDATSISRPIAGPGPGQDDSAATALRLGLFLVLFALVWITVEPFTDLSDPSLLNASDSGNILNQLAFSILGVAIVGYAWFTSPDMFQMFARRIYLLAFGWLALSVLWSHDPVLSARRLMFTFIVIALAALPLALPRSIKEFATLLGGLALFVLVLCYAGIMIAPDLTIHNEFDTLEPRLAGNWRGLWAHKNVAGPMMVIFVFIGLFVAKVRNVPFGLSIVIPAAVFLIFTAAKTSTALLLFILMVSAICAWTTSRWLRAVVALSLLVLLNGATIGSIFLEPVKAIVDVILPDASFTGRNEIWQFAVEHVIDRPMRGYGYAAFWRTEPVMFGSALADDPQTTNTANLAFHAHNAYLDLALQAGIPGLILICLWVLGTPLADYANIARTPENLLLGQLFLQIWLFGVYFSCLESALLDRANPIWFMMLVAMFGLRILTRYRIAP
jgi:O-antigen ligase